MVLIKNIKGDKISKGYRLKRTTHKLIDKLQKKLKADQDEIITRACEMLNEAITIKKNNKENQKKIQKKSGENK